MKRVAFTTVSGLALSYLTSIFAPFQSFLVVLLIMMVLDYMSGVVCAIYNKKLNSKIGAKGIAKKIGLMVVVSMACLLDIKIFGGVMWLGYGAIGMYIANEGLSILENVGKCGVEYPEKLKEILIQLKKSSDESEVD